MKKTLLSVLAGIAVIGSASAVPSVGDRKEMCEKKDGWVWVEKTQACIPVNPCDDSNDKSIIGAYCFPLEGTTESITNGISVWDVMDFYTEYKNSDCRIAREKVFVQGGKTLVPCIGNEYIVFELSGDDLFLVTDALCWIGGYTARMPYDGWPTQCSDASKDYCELLKQKFGDKTEIEHTENGTCVIGKWAEEYYEGEINGNPYTNKNNPKHR